MCAESYECCLKKITVRGTLGLALVSSLANLATPEQHPSPCNPDSYIIYATYNEHGSVDIANFCRQGIIYNEHFKLNYLNTISCYEWRE